MVGLLGGEGVVAKLHLPKRGPLYPCRFRLSAYENPSAIRPKHRSKFVSKRSAPRSHRPKHTPALALPRRLRLFPEQHRHLTKGLASPTIDATAGARRGYRFDVAILMSPSARERLPNQKNKLVLALRP